MLELLEAARTESEGAAPRNGGTIEDTWILAEVVSLSRAGWQNAVLAEFIGAPNRRRASFDFDSANDIMKPGDIFSLSDREISVFDLSAMIPKRYKTRNLQHPIQDG